MTVKTRLSRGRGAEPTVCGLTGLALRPLAEEIVFRIAKPSYGPMNPLKRAAGSNRNEWGRFDVVEQQTLYGGVPEEAAYAESLANFRVAQDISDTKLGALFDDEGLLASRKSLASTIEDEWRKSHHMSIRQLPAGWRQDRLIYEITLPPTGWLVDITHSESVAALNRDCRPLLDEFDVEGLTVADLLGGDRGLTTAISKWIWDRSLQDGSLPHGVLFPSKHGDDYTCVAVYLRALGDGKHVSSEPSSSDEGHEIEPPNRNSALKTVARLFDLKCW